MTASHDIKPERINSGKQATRASPQKGARHKAKIRIGVEGFSGEIESDDKWWILAMTAILIIGFLAAISLLKLL